MAGKCARQATPDYRNERSSLVRFYSPNFSLRMSGVGKLTGPSNCGKLNVYTARFFALRVLLVRMQQARRETQGESSSCR
ncbi:MAG: hypothetical protein DMG49_16120 [Acidobacteria bacterium]|nr:MAG: hypothetical protein DMG49_16120 [Acidobacteriota bacterium]